MSKDYNIDDILSEVKKRREENENEIVNRDKIAAQAEEVPAEEAPAEQPPVEDAPAEAPAEDNLIKGDTGDMPKTEEAETPASDEPERMVNLLELSDEEPEAPAEAIAQPAAEAEAPAKKQKKPKSKTQKILTAVIAILIALIVAAAALFAIKANDWLNLISNDKNDNIAQSEWQGMSKLIENFDPIQETEGTQLSSLEDMVKTWYYNGSPCSSSHVLNVLLVGEDTRGKEILEDDTRADAAIIASVNIDTKEIVLTSILRDSWAYWETTPGDESTGKFGKLNGAMSTGSLDVYINSVEKLYKIDIDSYAIVNFTSFEKIIDTLYENGIELELTSKEISEINNHPKRYGNVTIEQTFEGTKGKIRLNGKQALAYCRIRHIDTDNARADRQKTTLMQIYADFKDASTTKKYKLLNELVPYVKTGFSKNDIVKIAKYAFSNDWMSFDIKSFNYPTVNVVGGNYGSEFFKQWIWRADFPADAYDMQMRIYGKSSITLAKVRVDTKRVGRAGFYQEGARPTDYTYTNEAYGEATTCVPYDSDSEEEDEE